ncbi:cytochrome P450, partial [Corynespora cassiicola Philippines]
IVLLVFLPTSLLIYILYILLFHPLRHIPAAHPTAPFAPLWILHHRRNNSQALPAITRAHAQHGPLVRLGPCELSVSSYEGAHTVYIERGGFAKPRWWAETFVTYGVRNLVSMQGGVGSKEHARRKRDLGGVYAKSVLLKSEALKEIAARILGELRDFLNDLVREGGELDVYNFNGGVSADFVARYLFGERGGTRFASEKEERDMYFEKHGTFLEEKPGVKQAKAWLEDFGLKKCDDAGGVKNIDAVVYKQLRDRGLGGKVLASEMLDHFIAGAEAPRTTLTYLQWELSKRPTLQKRLRDEVWILRPNTAQSEDFADTLLDFKAVDSLPFLDALLMETLRVYTPTPGPQYRITPREGATIHGTSVPGGVQISSCLSILHRNEGVFPNPAKWEPERWLVADNEKLDEMNRWFWAFLKGSRICIGKDFTLIVMKLIIAAIYSMYSTDVVDDEGMEQEDKFLAGPVNEKLVLRF